VICYSYAFNFVPLLLHCYSSSVCRLIYALRLFYQIFLLDILIIVVFIERENPRANMRKLRMRVKRTDDVRTTRDAGPRNMLRSDIDLCSKMIRSITTLLSELINNLPRTKVSNIRFIGTILISLCIRRNQFVLVYF
jgi:hypothetical protein